MAYNSEVAETWDHLTNAGNKCTFREGLRKVLEYDVYSTRMSGELTTSFTNTLINACLLRMFARHEGQQCRFVVEGDDCLARFSG